MPALAVALTAASGSAAYAAEDTEPPSVPGQVTMVDYGPDGVLLSWAPSTDDVGVTGYHVSQQYSDVVALHSTPTNSIRIRAAASRSYVFSVRALDAANNASTWAPSVRLTMPPGDSQPPTTPTTLSVGTVEETSVSLSWGASTDNIVLSAYEVLSIAPSGNTVVARSLAYPPFYPQPQTYATVTGLAPRTTYTFAVRAVDEAGNPSALSTPVTVTTGPAPEPATCTVRYRPGRQSPAGTRAELVIAPNSSTAVEGWTLTWNFPANQRLYALWGAELVGRGDGNISVQNTRYNATIAPGGAATIGYFASASATPIDFWLNSRRCQAG